MRRLVFGLAVIAAVVLEAAAQQPPPGLPSPRISTVFPAGARTGGAVDVTVTGFDLDEPTTLLFSHPGIKGEYVHPVDPPDPKKKEPTKKDGGGGKGKKRNPGEPQPFKVTVDAGVPAGVYDLRVVGKWGVSNPRAFVVGDLPEVNEKEPNNDVPEAQKIEIGTTVNGVISSPTDVDYTVFTGKKGQRVVVSCLASTLDSRARPMIEVYDPAGRKLAFNRNYKDADAVADLVVPADGDYYIRLFQFTYQSGGADHTYRLTVSTAPWVDAVFPPAIEPGKPAQVTLYGRNLPGGQPTEYAIDGRPLEKAVVTITPPAAPEAAHRLDLRDKVDPTAALQDGFEYRLKGPGGSSNPVAVYFTREKAVVKKNSGGTRPDTAEPIPAPCEVVGMFHKKGDRDWYSFEAKKGDVLYVELTGERIGSAADFYFSIHSPTGKNDIIGPEQDDDPETLHPTEFYTRTVDPAPYKFTAPADGKYLVAVGCRESTYLYGPPTAYRLRVGPPRPDFRVVVKPYGKSTQTGSAGRQDGTEAYEVYVHRMDGFTGAVSVTAEGLPAGVTARPTVVGPAARWGYLVLDVGGAAANFTGPITVKATAQIAGKPTTREGRPAVVTWGVQPGQNIPTLSRLTQNLVLAVRPEKGFFKVTADAANAVVKPASGKEAKVTGPIVVKQGDKVTLPVKVEWVNPEKQNVTLAADPVSPNQQTTPVTMQPGTQPTKEKPEGVVTIDVKATAFPGTYGMVIRGEAQVPFVRDPVSKQKANLPAAAFSAPVQITIVPTSLAKVTPGAVPNGVVKLGATAEMTIKVERQYDYDGAYTVKYTPPTGATGLTAADVVIPAGKDEVKLVFQAAAGAKPGAVSGGLVVVTGQFDGKHPVATETKVNLTIGK